MQAAHPEDRGGRPRTVLVTGAARGIGAAIARRVSADGARVMALDRCSDDPALDYALGTRAQLDAVVADCGNGSVAVEADVADRSGLATALADVPGDPLGDGGALDAVVCAAGVVWGGEPAWSTPPAVWDALASANVAGVLNTAAATMPSMVARGSGRFVVVASAAAGRGLPLMGAYAATKAAAVSLVRSMAADLGDSGVTVNAVSPGSTDTDVLAASALAYGLGSPREFAQHHATARLVEPAEVAAAVAWLCSEDASAVTGAVLPVDGGMSAT